MRVVPVLLVAVILGPGHLCLSLRSKCTLETSVDISDGIENPDGTILHMDIVYDHESILRGDKTVRGCPCLRRPCVRKCCPEGQVHVRKQCLNSTDPMVNPFSPQIFWGLEPQNITIEDHFNVLYGNPTDCDDESMYLINNVLDFYDAYYIQIDGSLFMPNGGMNLTSFQYCIDAWPELEGNPNWTTHYLGLICFSEEKEGPPKILALGMVISVPFLVVTFLVYAILPELRNLHGCCLMCYVAGLAMGYAVLSYIQLAPFFIELSTNSCEALAFIIYFSYMVSFFWLNIMCFDMWWTFSGFRVPRGERKKRERRRFLLYCIYGFGMPALLTSIVATMQYHPNIPNHHIRPGIGTHKCWFDGFASELSYFYSVLIFLILINIGFFIATAVKIASIKRQTSVLRTADSSRHDQYENDKQRFNLYFKLFLVMGVNWALEWMSFLIGGAYYFWIITDIANTLQGVFVFFIFVWKKKIKSLLLRRYHLIRYGSTTSRGLSTSRAKTHNVSSTMETEKSFMSVDENGIKLQELNHNQS